MGGSPPGGDRADLLWNDKPFALKRLWMSFVYYIRVTALSNHQQLRLWFGMWYYATRHTQPWLTPQQYAPPCCRRPCGRKSQARTAGWCNSNDRRWSNQKVHHESFGLANLSDLFIPFPDQVSKSNKLANHERSFWNQAQPQRVRENLQCQWRRLSKPQVGHFDVAGDLKSTVKILEILTQSVDKIWRFWCNLLISTPFSQIFSTKRLATDPLPLSFFQLDPWVGRVHRCSNGFPILKQSWNVG